MPTTPAGIRYPASSASINIPQDLENLALDVDTYVTAQVGASVTPSSTTTMTNKTLNLTSNTLIGTKAQFNTAMSDADFATLTGTETLTNKTLTSPIISSISNTGTITIPTTTGTLALQADVTVASNLVVALEIAVIMAAF